MTTTDRPFAPDGDCPETLVFRHYYFRCSKTGEHDEHEYAWSGRTADTRLVWKKK